MKKILLHITLIVLITGGVFFGALRFLDSYTHHGQFVEVPDFRGQRIAALETFAADKDITYQIIDSLYDPKEKSGLVLRQDPDPGSKVKHNRTVYLYVTTQVPPQINMPRLTDRSERQAKYLIDAYGLKTGDVRFEKADCNGCVIAQNIRGQDIEPGTPVKKGTVINLVIGIKDPFFISDSLKTEAASPN